MAVCDVTVYRGSKGGVVKSKAKMLEQVLGDVDTMNDKGRCWGS